MSNDKKARKPFVLFDAKNICIGYGTFYPAGGNVQVYLKSADYAAHQYHSIAEVLLIPEVIGFRWGHAKNISNQN